MCLFYSEHSTLFHFMKDGHWEKHIRRICLIQKKKHDILLAGIQQVMGERVQVRGYQAGLHILLEFTDGQQEEAIVQKALRYGVEVRPVSPFWLEKNNYKGNAVVLGYGKIKEEDILPVVELLNSAWFK